MAEQTEAVQQWAEPPGRRSSSGASKMVAEALRGNKQSWAIIEEVPIPDDADEAKRTRENKSNRASLIRRGRIAAYRPAGTFDACSRMARDEGVIRVYARYLGEEFAEQSDNGQGGSEESGS